MLHGQSCTGPMHGTPRSVPQWVLDLPYPPPPEPQPVASAGEVDWSSQSLAVRAAWGPPELWPAHRIDALPLVQLAQLRRRHSDQGALPAGLSGR